jgi:hypothetical protein
MPSATSHIRPKLYSVRLEPCFANALTERQRDYNSNDEDQVKQRQIDETLTLVHYFTHSDIVYTLSPFVLRL